MARFAISELWLFLIYVKIGQINADSPYNVLLIIVDDLRPALGCYGDPIAHTPNIDAMAKNGIIFKNAHAQIAMCGPSRASFLTSRLPDSTGIYDLKGSWRSLGGNYTTLPQFFKENGYFAYSIGKIFHPFVVPNFRDDYPISWSALPFHSWAEKYTYSKACPDDENGYNLKINCPVNLTEQPGQTLEDIESVKQAKTFLSSYMQGDTKFDNKPFFLALGINKPHIPFKYPEKYKDLYPIQNMTSNYNRKRPLSQPGLAWDPYLTLTSMSDSEKIGFPYPFTSFDTDTEGLLRQNYYAAVSYVDDLIGDLMQHVNSLLLNKQTITVFMSDHSFLLGENQAWAKFSNYQAATRVPFIIIPPVNFSPKSNHVHKVKEVYDKTELLDLFPTLVDLAFYNNSNASFSLDTNRTTIQKCPNTIKRQTIQLCTEGKSLLPYFLDDKVNLTLNSNYLSDSNVLTNYSRWQYPRTLFYPNSIVNYIRLRRFIRIMGYTVSIDNYRYTEWVSFDIKTKRPNWSNVYARELYDLSQDPYETRNLLFEDGDCGRIIINKLKGNNIKLNAAYKRYHYGIGNAKRFSTNSTFLYYEELIHREGIDKLRFKLSSQCHKYSLLNDNLTSSKNLFCHGKEQIDMMPIKNKFKNLTLAQILLSNEKIMMRNDWLGLVHNSGLFYMHTNVNDYEIFNTTLTCTEIYRLSSYKLYKITNQLSQLIKSAFQ